MSVVIRPETAQDYQAIWSVKQSACGGDSEAILDPAVPVNYESLRQPSVLVMLPRAVC